ncbi:hypothetical protein XELAEV_18023368mg [Xenopus laevis]|uniref:Uncharacterized protein n=1 Tax=Xenopus laevis TaxID=8355 RepID=A0A974HPI1_XENLA|nr:hypothetical protein XELAEV_18023368mg [Xenopus laevis]
MFKHILRTELEATSVNILKPLTKEIRELGQRTDQLEQKMDDAITILDGHESDIITLKRENIRIRGLPETYKNLENEVGALLATLAPHLPPAKLELDKGHRSLGKPPKSGQPRDIIAKFHHYQSKQTTMKMHIKAILQSHNIKYHWSFSLRLNCTDNGRQYSPATVGDAMETLQCLHLADPAPQSPQTLQNPPRSTSLSPICTKTQWTLRGKERSSTS